MYLFMCLLLIHLVYVYIYIYTYTQYTYIYIYILLHVRPSIHPSSTHTLSTVSHRSVLGYKARLYATFHIDGATTSHLHLGKTCRFARCHGFIAPLPPPGMAKISHMLK